MSEHPAFARRRHQREAAELYDRMEPDWYADALCRSDEIPGGEGPQRAGRTWDAAFADEGKQYRGDVDASWDEDLVQMMATCARCPVIEPCLEKGYADISPVRIDRDVTFYVSHTPACDSAYYDDGATLEDRERARACAGCIPEEDRLVVREQWQITPMPAGVYGGVPGAVRQRMTIEAARRWFTETALAHGWVALDEEGMVGS